MFEVGYSPYISATLNLPVHVIAAGTLYGPLHTKAAVDIYKKVVEEARQQGGTVVYGGKVSGEVEESDCVVLVSSSELCTTATMYCVYFELKLW